MSINRAISQNKPNIQTVGIKIKRTDAEIIEDLQRVENDLSPENLCCDGELPQAEVKRRFEKLMREKRGFIAELGRTPTDKELYDYWGEY